MRNSALAVMGAALVLSVGIGLAAPAQTKEQQAHMDKRAREIDAITDKSPQAMETALNTISAETGVPVATVREQHRNHPKQHAAELMLANAMAKETKRDPEAFLGERDGGKRWFHIAADHNVSLDPLNARLDTLYKALAPAQKAK